MNRTTLTSFTTALALTGLLAPTGVRAATVQVDNANPNGWEFKTFDSDGNVLASSPTGYSGAFVDGPSTPPIGSGSAHLTVGPDGGGAVKLQTANFDGTKLSAITNLQYSTFVAANQGAQAPYIQIALDNDNDGVADDALFFEPAYQTGTYSTTLGVTIPDQSGGDGAPTVGEWETYNALSGGWWSNAGLDGAGSGGPPLTTLAHYEATFPDATIVSTVTGGGFRLVAGYGGPTDWGNFDGNVDGVGFNGTTYNFEVPEPTSIAMASIGGIALLLRRRRAVG